MSYLPKEKYGKKLLYRHSGGAIATIIFSLLMIGLYVATFFVPYQYFYEGFQQEQSITGVDFIMYVVKAISGETVPSLVNFSNEVKNNIFDGNGLVVTIMNVYYYIMTFFLVLVGIFAFVLAIGTLILLFKGSLKHWKLPASMSKRMFIYGMFFYAPICLLNLYNGLLKQFILPGSVSPTTGYVYPCIFTYIIFGGMFIISIIISIIYGKCFKDHVYVKDEETLNRYIEEYEKENLAVDLTEKEDIEKMEEESKKEKPLKQPEDFNKDTILMELPKPAEEKPVGPDKSEASKHLPKGIKVIGGHAYSQNTLLEDADIPEGIDVLGCGAFANCVNLRRVHIPSSVKKIEYNCFFNCIRLEKITYAGTRENWRKIKRGSNWLTSSGTNIVNCIDGAIAVERTK